MTDTDLVALGQSTLEHYGVKGMKWGIRKDRGSSGTRGSSKDGARKKPKAKPSQAGKNQLQSKKTDLGSLASMTSSEMEELNRRLSQEINLKRNIATLNQMNSPQAKSPTYVRQAGEVIKKASLTALGVVATNQFTHIGSALVSGDTDLMKKAAYGEMVKLDIQSGIKKKMNTIAGVDQGKKKKR